MPAQGALSQEYDLLLGTFPLRMGSHLLEIKCCKIIMKLLEKYWFCRFPQALMKDAKTPELLYTDVEDDNREAMDQKIHEQMFLCAKWGHTE